MTNEHSASLKEAIAVAEKLLERTETACTRVDREILDLEFKRDNYRAAVRVRQEDVDKAVKAYRESLGFK